MPSTIAGGSDGIRENKGYPPGTKVAVLRIADRRPGYILCAYADEVADPSRVIADFLQQAGGTTFFTEQVHRFPYLGTAAAGLPNYANGFADLLTGEWGLSNEFGVALALERFAVFLRTSEMCGVWASALDESLRIAARRLKVQTIGTESIDSFIRGELNRIAKFALLPHEAVGIYTAAERGDDGLPIPATAFIDPENGGKLGAKATDPAIQAATEPADPGLIMVPRILELAGYIVNGKDRYVVAPRPDKQQSLITDVQRYIGLFREHLDIDGSYTVQTAAGISLRKTVFIPAPHDIADPDDPTVVVNKPTDFTAFNWSLDTFGLPGTLAQMMEAHAYALNIDQFRRFTERTDWSVQDADPMSAPAQGKALVSVAMGNRQWASLPATGDWLVNPVGAKKYYAATAGIDIREDGSVVITDAWGSQIVMSGGNVVITAPGDIYKLPGRNAVTWAPGDIVLRAKGDVDVSSSEGSLRLKAERNLEVLAANGGEGGLLLESRGTNREFNTDLGAGASFVGITMKSDSAPFVLTGTALTIDIDTVKINATAMKLKAASFMELVGPAVFVSAGDTDSPTVYEFANGSLAVPGQVLIGGQLAVAGQVAFGNGVYVDGGTALFACPIATTSDDIGKRIRLQNPPPKTDGTVTKAVSALATALTTANTSLDAAVPDFEIDVLDAISFSFRLDTEYNVDHSSFSLPVAAWQQRLLATGDAQSWEESAVIEPVGGEQSTMPHPGRDTWTAKGKLILLKTFKFIDPLTGLPKPRDFKDTEPKADVGDMPLASYPTNV